MGGFLVIKLVKPTKIFCSWTPHQGGVGHDLFAKTKSHLRTAATRVLRKANTAVRQKICGFDSTGRALHQAAKLQALFLRYGSAQVLNLNQALANEYDLRNLRNAGHPRITNQLRIQRQQSVRLFRVSVRAGFPLEQTAGAIKAPDSIDVGNEVVLAAEGPCELDLQIPLRLEDPDAIVLAKPG
jgi:hypothetical protein